MLMYYFLNKGDNFMNEFAIFADATCDLSDDLRAKYNINCVKGHVTFPDGSQKDGICSWDGYDKDAFYKDLRKNPNGYSTSPASPEEFKEAFEPTLEEGKDILAICISTALSGTYNFMNQAKAELEKKYPDRKILVVDSLRFTTGFGLICVQASILRSEGKSIDEVYGWVEANKYNYHQCGYLDDLSFVAAKGRISKAKAFMGQLVGIKPFGEFDKNGLTTVLGQVKGDKAAIKGSPRLDAVLEGGFFPFKDVKYAVTSFTYMKEVRGVTSSQVVSGNTIPGDILSDISKKASGSSISFIGIKVSSPSGPRRYTPTWAAGA